MADAHSRLEGLMRLGMQMNTDSESRRLIARTCVDWTNGLDGLDGLEAQTERNRLYDEARSVLDGISSKFKVLSPYEIRHLAKTTLDDYKEQQRAAKERAEQERAAKERAEQERAERAEQERAEQERAEQERAEQERAAKERAEQERAEQERAEQERAAKERAEQKAKKEAEREAKRAHDEAQNAAKKAARDAQKAAKYAAAKEAAVEKQMDTEARKMALQELRQAAEEANNKGTVLKSATKDDIKAAFPTYDDLKSAFRSARLTLHPDKHPRDISPYEKEIKTRAFQQLEAIVRTARKYDWPIISQSKEDDPAQKENTFFG
jgi:hypothetical protein